MLDEEWLLNELVKAYYLARRAKRATEDEQRFEMALYENLLLLRNDLLERRYKPGRGIAFIVHDPVTREIFAAPFRDRVIHHFLFNMSAHWWDERLDYDTYSCRVGKGTLFGIKRLAHHVRSVTNNYTQPAYVIKLDIKGYFMSLPRDGLYQRVLWGLDRQFPDKGAVYSLLTYLWKQVIFDDPTIGVIRRGTGADWAKLPNDKSLFCQAPGVGIVIGNLSSQLLSNIYLDQLDKFVKNTLGYKHYGRYVDDFFMIVSEQDYGRAKADVRVIEQYLTTLGLTLHPKKRYMQNVRKGIPFLGTVVYPGWITPGRRSVRNYQRALFEVEAGERDLDSIISYMGLLKHINSGKIQQKIFDNAGLEYKF